MHLNFRLSPDHAFAALCEQVVSGERAASSVQSFLHEYTDKDMQCEVRKKMTLQTLRSDDWRALFAAVIAIHNMVNTHA